jgi:uncharacterized protein YyaL (SSP411 family)
MPMAEAVQNQVIHRSLIQLATWVERADYRAYDPFDGLSSPCARLFHHDRPLLKRVWQQAVRRFPFNLRPLLGIEPHTSSKAMGFFARGYLRLYETHGDPAHLEAMRRCLRWLVAHRSVGDHGHGWGNHFDYESRGGNIPEGAPTIVWTGLIAHAFLDAYEALGDPRDAEMAVGACEFIASDLGWTEEDDGGICLRYYPGSRIRIHNASMIGASLLARAASLSSSARYREIAERAVRFTVRHQTSAGAWYYGVGPRWAWIDSFHTGYVLEALHAFCRHAGDGEHGEALRKGHAFFLDTFFAPDGTPRYYAGKTRPLDIQCAAQGIQTLVGLRAWHPRSLDTAMRVARWTIAHMQDPTGYFYYRTYRSVTNKTPTLH